MDRSKETQKINKYSIFEDLNNIDMTMSEEKITAEKTEIAIKVLEREVLLLKQKQSKFATKQDVIITMIPTITLFFMFILLKWKR